MIHNADEYVTAHHAKKQSSRGFSLRHDSDFYFIFTWSVNVAVLCVHHHDRRAE